MTVLLDRPGTAFWAAVTAAGYRPLDVAPGADGVRVTYAPVRSNT